MSDISLDAFYYKEDFLNQDTFFNSVYALDLAIENNFSKMLFYNDLSRIVYASNDYCFRRRSEQSEEGLLDIPFLNYYLTNVSPDTDRMLKKNTNNAQTLLNLDNYVAELGFEIKIVPIHLEYESTAWFSNDKDLQYATSKLMFQDTNETVLYGMLESSNGTILKNPAFLTYSFNFKPEYNETEWLESNNISSIGIDMSFDTFIVYPNTEITTTPQAGPSALSITNEVILDFLSTKGSLYKDSDLLNTPSSVLLTTYFS